MPFTRAHIHAKPNFHERARSQVEDTPELETFFAESPWASRVDATFTSGTHRDYFAQMDRQSAHMLATVPKARAEGLTHLLHVDDDELVYCSAGVHVLRAELAVRRGCPVPRPSPATSPPDLTKSHQISPGLVLTFTPCCRDAHALLP